MPDARDHALTRRAWLRLGAGGVALLASRRLRAAAPAAAEGLASPLIVRLDDPYCAEGRLPQLVERWVTSARDFFVVDHDRVPRVDPARYVLEVVGAVRRPLRLTLTALLALPVHTVPATLMCAGNRRRELHAIRPVDDPVLWGAGAIGNAWWTGARLADVLAQAGVLAAARHVWFEGLDAGFGAGFGGSIPLARVVDPAAPPVVLAYRMNRAPLPLLHGAPVRAVVPGFIGARSVKWLGRIVVSDVPSRNPFFLRNHRLHQGGRDTPLYQLPVNAVVCGPVAGAAPGRVRVAGYAIAGDPAATVRRVEISTDGGVTWRAATLGARARSAWTLWHAELDARSPTRLVARAIDSAGRVQPERAAWNDGGYLYNGWSSVVIG